MPSQHHQCLICLQQAEIPVRLSCQCAMACCAECLLHWLYPADASAQQQQLQQMRNGSNKTCPTCRRRNVEPLIIVAERGTTRSLTVVEMARIGQGALVDQLIQHGASWLQADEDGNTPLHAAAAAGHLSIVKNLVENWMAPIDERNGCKETPLMLACEGGHLKTVMYLVKKGADAQVRDDYKTSVLHKAVQSENLLLFRYLVEHCCLAPDQYIDRSKEHCLHAAASAGLVEFVSYMLTGTKKKPGCIIADPVRKDDCKNTALQLALERGSEEIAHMLLLDERVCASVRADKNDCKESCLHSAVSGRCFEIAKTFIIDYGLDPLALSDGGENAATIAVAYVRNEDTERVIDFLTFLRDRCAVDLLAVRNGEGANLLDLYSCDQLSLLQFLVEGVGLDPAHVHPDDEDTALHRALSNDAPEDVLEYLESFEGLRALYQPEALSPAVAEDDDDDEETASDGKEGAENQKKATKKSKAAAKGKKAKSLLSDIWCFGPGALRRILQRVPAALIVNSKDDDGTTPLMNAAHRDGSLVAVLLECGADPSAVDEDGINAAYYAARTQAIDGLAVLKQLVEAGGNAARDLWVRDTCGDSLVHQATNLAARRRRAMDFNAQLVKDHDKLASEARKKATVAAGADPSTAQIIDSENCSTTSLNASGSGDDFGKQTSTAIFAPVPGALDETEFATAIIDFLIGHPTATPELIQRPNKDGETLLHYLASDGDAAGLAHVVSRLTAACGGQRPPSTPDKHGNHPIHTAAESGNVHAALFLRDLYPETAFENNKKGRTPAAVAQAEGYAALAEALLVSCL